MTNKKIEEIMKKSGNVFHSQVVKALRDKGWFVTVSPYYSDNFTDKPREIDIIAEKKFDAISHFGNWLGTVNVRLFIECKYVANHNVFWFDNIDKNKIIDRIRSDTNVDYSDFDRNSKKHHYLADSFVAKLFSSENNRNGENELMGKAINQNLNALVYYRNKTDFMPEDPKRPYSVLQSVSYPIIVVNSFDKFFRTNMEDVEKEVTSITEPFKLEVNYAYIDKEKNAKNEYFLIDVLSIDNLDDFFSDIEENEIQEIREKIDWDDCQNGRQ
ncbi:MAG: hypothetical protein PHY30_00590 [Candidatus Pacebacteria bacterium]|nr:hypothetical protein [Candidatus Paceibacterota bacterium]